MNDTKQKVVSKTSHDAEKPVRVRQVNQAGGTSESLDWLHGNAHRGCCAPASIQWPVDDQEDPYVNHEAHLDSHGNTIEGIVHDHSPAPGSLPSPEPQKKGTTYPSIGGGKHGAGFQKTLGGIGEQAASVSTSGKIGK
jgi:hypothetical protein